MNKSIFQQANNDQVHLTTVQQQNADLSVITENVTKLNDASLLSQEQFREIVVPIIPRLEKMSEMSATQSENMHVLLRAIYDQVSGTSNHVSQPERMPLREKLGSDVPTPVDINEDSENDHELMESIERLCQLAQEKAGTTTDSEAEIIIDDLNALLGCASGKSLNSDFDSCASQKRPLDMVQQESSDDGRELKRIRSLLTSSDSVMINPTGMWITTFQGPCQRS